jgi:hypothetical protein
VKLLRGKTSSNWLLAKSKVKLQLNISRPMYLGAEPHLGLMTKCFYSYLLFLSLGAPSLMKRWLSALWFLVCLIFYPEDGVDTFVQNVGSCTDYMALYQRTWKHSGLVARIGCLLYPLQDSCNCHNHKLPLGEFTWSPSHQAVGSCHCHCHKIWGFHGSEYEECHLPESSRVALVRTGVLKERVSSIIRVTISNNVSSN